MAIVLTSYYRPKPGGLCTRLFRAIRALLDRGHTVHYLAVEPFPIDNPQCVFHRFPWPVRYSDTLLFWAVFHLLAPILLCFIALKHRVTHAFAFGTTYAFLMQPLRLLLRIDVTCFLRGDTILNHRLRLRQQWIITMELWIEGAALTGMRLVGVSKPLLDTILKRHPRINSEDQRILPNDLTPTVVMPAKRFRPPLRLATVGILEPMKNHVFVIRLLRALVDHPWHLYLYGPGPERRRLTAAVQQWGLEQKVSFMGWVDQARIWSRTDLLLSASIHEGMPNAVLEAISNGVPILASDIPAHRGVLPSSQLLPIDDSIQWHSTLLSILREPEPAPVLHGMLHNQNAFADYLRFDWDEQIVPLITCSNGCQ